MERSERSSVLDILIKKTWYKAQITLSEMCLTVSLLESYLDTISNDSPISPTINEIRRIRIVKTSDNNFGISIKGGKENKLPIFISKIFKDSPADQTGQLNIGDSILSVNGESLIDATHEDAVKALKRAGNKAELEVKYLREVMLQYKKASLLPEIGWDFKVPNSNNSLNEKNDSFILPKSVIATSGSNLPKVKSDTKIISLLLCYLQSSSINFLDQNYFKSLIEFNDPRIIAIFSPDLKNSLVIRFPDELKAYTWSAAILSEIHNTNLYSLPEANYNLSETFNSCTIKYMGWLNEKVNDEKYRPTFLVLTTKEILFFDEVPYSLENWKYPTHRYPLEQCRLVHEKNENLKFINNENNLNNSNINKENLKLKSNNFMLRIGTEKGIIVVQLNSESYQCLLFWAKKIIQTSYNTAIAIQEISFDCVFEGTKCNLILNVNNGFIVKNQETNEILFQKDFSELIGSSDDNARFVTLQFRDEKVSRDFDMLKQPKPFIFTLHTFLFVKLTKLGII